jgi:hypothetical protein
VLEETTMTTTTESRDPVLWLASVHGAAPALSEYEIRVLLAAAASHLKELTAAQTQAHEHLARPRLSDEYCVRIAALISAEARLMRALQQAQIAAGLPEARRSLRGAQVTEAMERKYRWTVIEACAVYLRRYGNLEPAPRPPAEVMAAVNKGVAALEPEGTC